MKRDSFFSSLFRSADAPAESKGPTQVVITEHSQPHVLNQRMREEKLTHGKTVTANLSPVRLEHAYGRMVLYFCPMKTIDALHTISEGDGGMLPAEAKVEGLTVPENFVPGYYALKNVTLTSNGSMQVKATEATAWELVKPERY